MKRILVFSILIVIPAFLIVAFWDARPAASALTDQGVEGVGAAWYHPDWHYRRPVTVNNTSTSLTDYQVLVSLDSAFDFSHARTDGFDLRVTANDGTTPLSFWVESWDSVGLKAWVWVKVPSLPNGSTVIYLYYGNPSAASASDGNATFDAYDGFESYSAGTAPTGNYTNPGEWARYASNPVLPLGAAGTWDSAGATFASVVYDSAVTPPYRMYYHGWGATPCAGSCIGLATSSNGLSWTKDSHNPILRPGVGITYTWEASGVRVPMVWKEGSNDYRMIYTGSGSGGMQVGYATSADGISWTKYASNPVFNDPTWAHGSTENWGVIKVDNTYLMWYSDLNVPRQSGIATSTDLINWTPYSTTPIFATSGVPSDYRYSQFCPYTFVYGGYYYVLVPSYTSVGDYSRYYLYRSSSPYFPTSDRHLVRVAHTIGGSGLWDSIDSDTPAVLTSDILRNTYPNNQLLTYYAGINTIWREGLLVETNIDTALADAALPHGLLWTAESGITVVSDPSPVRQGLRSVRINKTTTGSKALKGTFSPINQGVVGMWMRRDNTTTGDLDIYLYQGGTLAAVGGLGRSGGFHYWNGAFFETGVAWSTNTWYLVTLVFNADTDRYDFVVYNQSLSEIVRVNSIAFGNSVNYLDTAWLYGSSNFIGNGYGDDFRLRKYVSPEPSVAVRSTNDIQETQAIAGTGTPDFSLVGISMTVTTQGSLANLQVIRYGQAHPFSPDAQKLWVRRYWEIIPNGDASGYQANLTLPHPYIPDAGDTVCFYVSGTSWNCAANSYNTVAGTITRNGITQFSEWTTQEDFDPTAVTLKNLSASTVPQWFVPGLIAATLAGTLIVIGLLRLRHSRARR